MTTEYTPNFRFNMPDFRMGPWHDLLNGNTARIDQILLAVYQGIDTSPWQNNTPYTAGQTAIDLSDNSFWVCAFDHTSAPEPTTFAEDRAAHPTHWVRTVVGINPRGQWANDTHYLVNDMVSDPTQGLVALCITEHDSIEAPGTIRDDGAYWTFLVDMLSGNQAVYVVYDNTASGSIAENLQEATDDLYAKHEAQDTEIAANALAIAAFDPRIDDLEASDADQAARIVTLESNDVNQSTDINNLEAAVAGHETRLDNIEGADFTEEAPEDSLVYGRQNGSWVQIVGGSGVSLAIGDNPPADPVDGMFWWESDTGTLYLRFNDGTSTQWVIACPPGVAAATFAALSEEVNELKLAIAEIKAQLNA